MGMRRGKDMHRAELHSLLLPKKHLFQIAPSILSADFCTLEKDIKKVLRAGCTIIHLDVMDGHFVPNLTFGPPLIRCVRKHFPKIFLDAHLMIENPLELLDDFVESGANLLTVHTEVCRDVRRAVQRIHDAGLFAGLSIKPKTSIKALQPALNEADLILIMSVEPGYGGQKIIPHALNKVRDLRLLREREGYSYVIEIDGGIEPSTAPLALAAGAEIFVAGSAIFRDERVTQNIRALERSLEDAS
jgi:ribulose-phosphate 3-epimerase